MNDWTDRKTKQAGARDNAARTKPEFAREHSNVKKISDLLHHLYDGALSEPLPDSFVALLETLDRKGRN
jgi:hypothetical protein